MTDYQHRWSLTGNTLWPWGVVVFVVAFALRLVFLLQFQSVPLFNTPIMDMLYFHNWAVAEVDGRSFVNGPYFKAPLYPLFLGLVYRLFGEGPWGIRLVQAFLGSLSAVLTFLIGARLFSRRTGFVAGLMAALGATLIIYDAQLLVPCLAIFLNLVAVYLLICGFQSDTKRLFLIAGIALGLSAIARPTVLLFAAGIVVFLAWEWWRRSHEVSSKSIVLFVVGLALAITPVTVRNYIKSGEFVPIGTYSGINLYIGNNIKSDGVSTRLPGAGLDWWGGGEMKDAIRLAETDAGRSLSATERSAYWRDRAVEEIWNNPAFFLKHLVRKLFLFISGLELFNNFDIYYFAHKTSVMKLLLWKGVIYFPWGIILPLAVVGIMLVSGWTIERKLCLLFLLTYLPTLLLFFVTSRYRLPMLPILMIFASHALVSGYGLLKKRQKSKWFLITGLFVVLLILGQSDIYGFGKSSDAQGHEAMAAIYSKRGNDILAERYYRLALSVDPTLPHANNDLGLLLSERGKYDEAIRLLTTAVQYEPGDYVLQYNLGTALLGAGKTTEAIKQFRTVLRQVPNYYDAANNIGLAWLQLGEVDSSLATYQQALIFEPDRPEAYYAVGYVFHVLGELDTAEVYYMRSLQLNDQYAMTYYALGQVQLQRGATDSAEAYLRHFLSLSSGRATLEAKAAHIVDSLTGTSSRQ